MSVSKITQKVAVRFSPNYICRFLLPISRSSSHVSHFDLLFDLVYSGVEMSVSKITKKIAVRLSPNYICSFSLPMSRSNSHVSHFDLLFDLVFSGVEMCISKITQKVAVRFSPNYICRFLLAISRSSLHMPTHQTSEHGTCHSLYHAPGVAPFAKNTIILSRRGTLELRVHWLPVTPRSILLVLNGHDPGSLTLVQSDGEKSGN